MYTLYHYIHCPFCIRIRQVLGYLQISYNSKVLDYNDEKTPVELSGIKMLPIVTTPSGKNLNESLDIIKLLDNSNKLKSIEVIENYHEIEVILDKLGKNIHNLAMPYFIYTPEFNLESRQYFQAKKEIKRGPFKELYHNRERFLQGLNKDLVKLEEKINPYYQSETLTLNDILLASHLWGMYIVPEFQFSPKLHNYLQAIKRKTNFEYHRDSWL